jgi:hypothetical protein
LGSPLRPIVCGRTASKRKTDFEPSLTGLGFKFDFAPMPIGDDAVTDDQSQAGPGADPFGGKKGFEYPGLDFRGYASPVVHDFDNQLIIFDKGADADLA